MHLKINDVLYSKGSWTTKREVIVSTTEATATTDKGKVFAQPFLDGSAPVNHKFTTMDFNFWHLEK